jgi:hypothetical protein
LSAAAALVIALPAQALDLKLLNNGKLLDVGNSNGVSVNIGGGSGVTADVGGKLLNSGSGNTLDVGVGLGSGSGATTVGAAVNLLDGKKGTGVDVGVKTGVLGTDIGLGLGVNLGLGLGGGGTGGGTGGGGTGGGGNGGGGTGGSGGVLMASLGNPALCAAPTAGQVATLLKRQTYNYAGLAQATRIKIVPVELCLGVRDQLSNALLRSAGVAQLQHFLATSPSIQRNLMRKGYELADVLAVDLQGNTLIVYVI